jgi:hypothetical protein
MECRCPQGRLTKFVIVIGIAVGPRERQLYDCVVAVAGCPYQRCLVVDIRDSWVGAASVEQAFD